jgi:hypothetical protein
MWQAVLALVGVVIGGVLTGGVALRQVQLFTDRERAAPWGVTTHLVTPPTHTRGPIHPGRRDDAAEQEPSHLLGHHAPTVGVPRPRLRCGRCWL